MAKFRQPSQAVLAARARREARADQSIARTEWFINEVSNKVAFTLEQRVKIATEFLKNKIIKNISRPVKVGRGPRGGRVVEGRSKPGEYPKADTTQLMKSIFSEVFVSAGGVVDGAIGTPLDYGLILEMKMDRSFLVRTLNEEKPIITRILTGPIR